MPLVTERANTFLDFVLGTPGFLPSTVYVGLLTAAPNPDGTGIVEPVAGGAYARVAVANDVGHWPAASSRTKTHVGDIIFPEASANWGFITHVGIFSAASGANLKIYNTIDVARMINANDIFRFLAGVSPLKLTA